MCPSWLRSKIAMWVMTKKCSIIIKTHNILHMWKVCVPTWICLCWLIQLTWLNIKYDTHDYNVFLMMLCCNPTLAKCEDETHTLKVGDLESSGTPENLELDCRGQNTSHRGVLDIIGKVLKCRCPKWPRMSHLDICSPSYGQRRAGSQTGSLIPNH
jgi:hypothetical protein